MTGVQTCALPICAITHQAFLDAGLWDEIRVETAVGKSVEKGTEVPRLPHEVRLLTHEEYDGNVIDIYERSKY